MSPSSNFKLETSNLKRGFMLLEVVLALAVFGIAATGFTVALHRMAKVADLAQSELRITRILESSLTETLSLPQLEIGTTTAAVAQTGIEIDTTIELIEDLEAEDGQLLQDMYRITLTAVWFEAGEWQKRSIETWRYGRMYQPQ